MGIRFQCPNGHKLHVKTQLAGQHGFCPECNARVQIPTPSSPAEGSQADGQQTPAPPTPAAQPEDSQPAAAPPQPVFDPEGSARGESILAPQPEVPKARPKAIPKARPVRPAAPPATPPTNPEPDAAPAAPQAPEAAEASPSNPLVSGSPPPPPTPATPPPPPSPQVQWHLQTATGEQLGPAAAAEVVGWQSAGLLVDEAHVWRTGWTEWRAVGDARGELPLAAPATLPSLPQQPATEEATRASAASKYVEKRRRAAKRQVYVAVILLLLVIGVGVAMAIVLNRPAQPEDPLPPAAASDEADQPPPLAEPDRAGPDGAEPDAALPGQEIMDDAMDDAMSQ